MRTKDVSIVMIAFATGSLLISRPPTDNTWTRKSLSSERKPLTLYICVSTDLGSPGACAMTNQNVRTQTKSQTARSALVDLFLNNQAQFVSLVVIIGKHVSCVF